MAITLPRGLARDERRGVLTAVRRVREEGLKLGALGRWNLEPSDLQRPLVNLLPQTLTGSPRGATQWATVTPIAFDQHAKAKEPAAHRAEVAAMIHQACLRIELPEPRDVVVTAVSAHLGAPAAHQFPRLVRKDGGDRRHSHAVLIFAEPVQGPMLLGAGRYRGYGVCRPLEAEA